MKFTVINKNLKTLIKSKRFNSTMHVITIEELAELQQAVSKRYRGRQKSNDNLIEEIADVMISLDFIIHNYDIKYSDIQKNINQKLDRMDKRIKSKSFS